MIYKEFTLRIEFVAPEMQVLRDLWFAGCLVFTFVVQAVACLPSRDPVVYTARSLKP